MKPNRIITLLLLMLSLTVFAQSDYYYYKGQRIPLTINPKKVNIITPLSNMQHAPSFRPNMLKPGLEIEKVVNTNNVSMCVIKEKMTHSGVLNQYVDSILERGISKVLSCYLNSLGEDLMSSGYIYIKLKTASDSLLLKRIASRYDLIIDHRNQYMPLWYVLSMTKNDERLLVSMTEELYYTGYFAAVEPDLMYCNAFQSISWDANVSEQWGLYNTENDSIDINASSAWNYATGRGVKIGVFDSGIDHNHNDLKNNISPLCYDIETGTNQRTWYVDHGTHVAGIAAASRNNGIFGAGVAPDAKIVSISAKLNHMQPFTTEKIANGFNWAAINAIDVINCSWFWGKYEIIADAMDNALNNGRYGKGAILVIATGNFDSSVTFPANYNSEILAIGAINRNGLKEYFSNYGPELDVVAPGGAIYSTVPDNLDELKSGTSMAAPHVAGVAALILELNPDLTGQQVRDIIEQSTIKVGNVEYTDNANRPNGTWNQYYGYGLVDALKAVQNTPRKQIEY